MLNRCNSPQNASKPTASCVRFSATATNIETDNVLAICGEQIHPYRQPVSDLLNARLCVSKGRQNPPDGKIENSTTVFRSIIPVSLITGRNSKSCSSLRFYPRRYPIPLILHQSFNRAASVCRQS